MIGLWVGCLALGLASSPFRKSRSAVPGVCWGCSLALGLMRSQARAACSWASDVARPLTACPHPTPAALPPPLPPQLVPALSKWGGAVVGLTLLAIGAMGLYETFFEQHEEGEAHESDPAAEALTGALLAPASALASCCLAHLAAL